METGEISLVSMVGGTLANSNVLLVRVGGREDARDRKSEPSRWFGRAPPRARAPVRVRARGPLDRKRIAECQPRHAAQTARLGVPANGAARVSRCFAGTYGSTAIQRRAASNLGK